MSTRRLQMVILSAPRILESTKSVKVHPNLFPDMNRQFFPMIRYHNPKLEIGSLPAESEDSAAITFNDESQHVLRVVNDCFSTLMQKILDCDREKSVELLSKRQTSDS